MKSKVLFILAAAAALVVTGGLLVGRGSAQELRGWSRPYQLSTLGRTASEGYPVSDDYGNVHVFWSEEISASGPSIIQYARFDGSMWSIPIDLVLTRQEFTIGGLTPYVDSEQAIHLIYSQGLAGQFQTYYIKAPANNAVQIQSWSAPVRVDVNATNFKLIVDDAGKLHLLYSKTGGPDIGLYYTYSEDDGSTWSDSVWLDPDIPPNHLPNSLQFEVDEQGGLHAAWYYSFSDTVGGNWVRYIHSLDGGDTWSLPQTMAQDTEEGGTLALATPVMAVAGDMVHIVWAGGELHYRNHSFSRDRGLTWSDPLRIFGDLNGQAKESLIADDYGGVHYFGQIRYPQGIYHAVWKDGLWQPLELAYLISIGSGDPIGDHIHAHHTFGAFRAGNEIVMTFADPPPTIGRRLFAMTKYLDEYPSHETLPTPTEIVPPTGTPPPTPRPTSTPTPSRLGPQDLLETDDPSTGFPLLAGLASTSILLLALLFIRAFFSPSR